MYGRTANSHAYMDRVASHSTKGSRRGFVDVETGVNPADLQAAVQRRDNLKRRQQALIAQRQEVHRKYGGKAEYKRIGQEIQDIQNEIAAINSLVLGHVKPQTFDFYFSSCARSMLTNADYERIAEAARQRMLENGETTAALGGGGRG